MVILMRKEYCYDSFYQAHRNGYEGFIIYKDNTVEFFKWIEEANEAFEGSPDDVIACGEVSDAF